MSGTILDRHDPAVGAALARLSAVIDHDSRGLDDRTRRRAKRLQKAGKAIGLRRGIVGLDRERDESPDMRAAVHEAQRQVNQDDRGERLHIR